MPNEADLFLVMCRMADDYVDGEATGDELHSAVVDYTDAVLTRGTS